MTVNRQRIESYKNVGGLSEATITKLQQSPLFQNIKEHYYRSVAFKNSPSLQDNYLYKYMKENREYGGLTAEQEEKKNNYLNNDATIRYILENPQSGYTLNPAQAVFLFNFMTVYVPLFFVLCTIILKFFRSFATDIDNVVFALFDDFVFSFSLAIHQATDEESFIHYLIYYMEIMFLYMYETVKDGGNIPTSPSTNVDNYNQKIETMLNSISVSGAPAFTFSSSDLRQEVQTYLESNNITVDNNVVTELNNFNDIVAGIIDTDAIGIALGSIASLGTLAYIAITTVAIPYTVAYGLVAANGGIDTASFFESFLRIGSGQEVADAWDYLNDGDIEYISNLIPETVFADTGVEGANYIIQAFNTRAVMAYLQENDPVEEETLGQLYFRALQWIQINTGVVTRDPLPPFNAGQDEVIQEGAGQDDELIQEEDIIEQEEGNALAEANSEEVQALNQTTLNVYTTENPTSAVTEGIDNNAAAQAELTDPTVEAAAIEADEEAAAAAEAVADDAAAEAVADVAVDALADTLLAILFA